jgi:hypothetical protein
VFTPQFNRLLEDIISLTPSTIAAEHFAPVTLTPEMLHSFIEFRIEPHPDGCRAQRDKLTNCQNSRSGTPAFLYFRRC